MESKIIDSLIVELRNEGIPPFCKNDTLLVYLKQGDASLKRYVCNIDYENDHTARELIKTYALYCFNRMTNEFFTNYAETLVSWQMSKVNNDV